MYNGIVQLYNSIGLKQSDFKYTEVVKPLSLSKKRVIKYVATGIIVVSLFAAAVFYFVPGNSQTGPIAFALGALDSTEPNSTAYCMTFLLNVTFTNGTSVQNPSELNSTDIQQIQFEPCDNYYGCLYLPCPWGCAFEFANSFQIVTGVTGETPLDLGMIDIVNSTFSFYAANGTEFLPPGPPYPAIPTLNYPLQANSTGYWSLFPCQFEGQWSMNIDQIQSILANTTDPVNIVFNVDLNSIVYYQLTTTAGTQSGSATEQYSGPCATLQLLHDGDQLLGFVYNCSPVGLTMTGS